MAVQTPMKCFSLSVLAICALLFSSAPTFAQTSASTKDTEKAAEQALTRIDESMVTMSSLVEALSNTLGQLHYLRTLCYTDEDQHWRKMANSMMKIEVPKDSARKRRLIRAFNAGYYEQKERYTQCSNTVAIDVAALAENGRRVAAMLGDPYRER